MLAADDLKRRALELGFDLCGIAPAAGHPELRALRGWIDRGFAGGMQYLARTLDRRADVRAVLPSARSVVVLGTVYNVDRPYSTEVADPRIAKISRYAWGDDYHVVIGRRMADLAEWMRQTADAPFEARAYVDTGPVQERVYAQYAGLGWIGKNTCLINPGIGSWLFLSEIICSLPLAPDAPGLDQCGTCTLCLEACPTNAIVEPYVLDATRCISYLTIELRGAIPEPAREGIGTHVFGCDVCQDVCPWNGAPVPSGRPEWQPRPEFDRQPLTALWARSDAELAALLRESAMSRAGVHGLRRNVATALGNAGEASGAAALEAAAADPARESARLPLVADHVQWARHRLAG